jgi:hypothetical protein
LNLEPHRRCTTLGLEPSFGFGDRIGLATPGHVAAMQAAGGDIAPIFPQQSIREMTRTGRSPAQVMRDAIDGAAQAGWSGAIGADADHLKTPADVDATAAAGFTFFTIDPSGFVDPQADNYPLELLQQKFEALSDEVTWLDEYLGESFELPSGSRVELNRAACLRAAVKYGRAINHAAELADHIDTVQAFAQRDYEIELSIDETPQPTTLSEHYIIVDQCLSRDMKLVSLAPRFIGEFEKGVDYKGDLARLEASLEDHAALAFLLGEYKLSLHSGSDKLSMYPALARATRQQFHVKTAGTSYLEALRVVARHEPAMFRSLIEFCRTRYDADKATYHVSATLESVPSPAAVDRDAELEQLYLQRWGDVPEGRGFTAPGRQILHCTFGSALTDHRFGPAIRDILTAHRDTYAEVLKEHFSRHLRALQA